MAKSVGNRLSPHSAMHWDPPQQPPALVVFVSMAHSLKQASRRGATVLNRLAQYWLKKVLDHRKVKCQGIIKVEQLGILRLGMDERNNKETPLGRLNVLPVCRSGRRPPTA